MPWWAPFFGVPGDTVSEVEFHNPEAPVEHQLLDVVYATDDPTSWVISLAAAEQDGMHHVELRLERGGDDLTVVLSCWEGTTESAGPPESWGASLSGIPELVASAIRVVLSV